MRRYTATIFDVTDDLAEAPFELPTSSLVPCEQAVTFSFVVPGHRYAARVRGYDRTNLRKQSSGSPLAVDANGVVVAPRWTTECGIQASLSGNAGAGGVSGALEGDASSMAGQGGSDDQPAPGFSVKGITSASRFTVYADYCLPLVDHGPTTATRISIGLEAALGKLSCGDGTGEVSEFSAELIGVSAPPVRTPCGETATFDEVEPHQTYRLNVLAYEKGAAAPHWQTACRVTALPGAVTPASCDPLRTR